MHPGRSDLLRRLRWIGMVGESARMGWRVAFASTVTVLWPSTGSIHLLPRTYTRWVLEIRFGQNAR